MYVIFRLGLHYTNQKMNIQVNDIIQSMGIIAKTIKVLMCNQSVQVIVAGRESELKLGNKTHQG